MAWQLYTDITAIFYDLKELVSKYRGNLIMLVIGFAVPIFYQYRNNEGMFS